MLFPRGKKGFLSQNAKKKKKIPQTSDEDGKVNEVFKNFCFKGFHK